jgi:ABC-type multidrug transport system ATPase subunit
MVDELRAEGTTILLTTQYLEEADRLAQLIAVIDRGRIVAQGSASSLKERVGSVRLVVQIAERGRLEDARTTLRAVSGDGTPEVTGDAQLSMAMADHSTPAAVVRALDGIGVGIAGLEVHRPTLDDVFLTLTGRRAAADDQEQAA